MKHDILLPNGTGTFNGVHDAHPPSSTSDQSWLGLIEQIDLPLAILRDGSQWSLVPSASLSLQDERRRHLTGFVPAVPVTALGEPSFLAEHGIRYAYISGAMANGIASVELVAAMGRAGMLGFFGAAGLGVDRISDAVNRLKSELGDRPFGVNLIHSPQDPRWEEEVTQLLIDREVHLIEASAYLSLTLPLVRYRLHGIHEDAQGRIVVPNSIIAKISRIEVASKFMSPAPEKFLKALVDRGQLTEAQANLARRVPIAQDYTAEADSGGHTDNRPAIALLPTILALRDRMQKEYGSQWPLRVGLGGGIATPASALAAFSMGAAYVLTGSINQACVESGTSDQVRTMLAQAEQADIAMAPAADMFEMGVNVQVLKRGTMFAMRAGKLYEFYRRYPDMQSISATDRKWLEKNIFRGPVDEVWAQTQAFFQKRDPSQLERANRDPKHQMALLFRWYLGQSSRWANSGMAERKIDYQVWCGPAMGAFNEWVRDSFLAEPQHRKAVTVAQNIMYGASLLTRVNQLRMQGFPVSANLAQAPVKDPRTLKEFFD